MRSELAKNELFPIDGEGCSQTSPVDFEFAYQARVAIDRIRFAIRATEQATSNRAQLREAGLQLLDALDRLETAEHNFQKRFRGAGCEVAAPRPESMRP